MDLLAVRFEDGNEICFRWSLDSFQLQSICFIFSICSRILLISFKIKLRTHLKERMHRRMMVGQIASCVLDCDSICKSRLVIDKVM